MPQMGHARRQAAHIPFPGQARGRQRERKDGQHRRRDAWPYGAGISTFYLVEELPGVWKRLNKGDYLGRNGNVAFPQLADSRRKLIEVTAFLDGRKPAGIVSLLPGYLDFDPEGSLSNAFRRWALGYARLHPSDYQEDNWQVESNDIAAVRETLFKGQRATSLVPVYD